MAHSSFNRPIGLAALLFALTALIHAFLGGPEINAPVQASTLDPVVRAVSAVVWHALTALFLVLALALWWAARHPNTPLLLATLALTLSFSAIFLLVGSLELGNLSEMPQWTLFAAIAICLGLGLRGQRRARERSTAAF